MYFPAHFLPKNNGKKSGFLSEPRPANTYTRDLAAKTNIF